MKILEEDDYIFLDVILLFLLINFNLPLGVIYIAMALIGLMAYHIARDINVFRVIPMEKTRTNRLEALLWGVGVYVVFIVITSLIFTVTKMYAVENYQSIITLIGQSFSATPVFAESKFLSIIVWGLLIPIVETKFFFRTIFQWGAHYSKINIAGFTRQVLILMVVFAGIFTVFHATTKGITNVPALLTTFIFGLASLYLVVKFREVKQATILHVVSNTLASLSLLKLGLFSV